MQNLPANSVELPFSEKYNRSHSEDYFHRHRRGLAKRLSSWREIDLVRKSLKLAGSPNSVLDLPCGAGRFWPVLMEEPNRFVIGADYSADMLAVASEAYPEYCAKNIQSLQTSAFNIDLTDSAVDCILCIRFLHHVKDAVNRRQLLKEFHRVTRDTVIISLWVDGNYKAWRRHELENKRRKEGQPESVNRFVHNRSMIEAEFTNAGFDILGHFDMVPLYQMWRTYVLRKR